jgi:signal transduction histidine kinase
VAVDAQTGLLDTAWGQIPHSPQATAGIGSFTRSRVERIISLVGGAFSPLVLGLQAFLTGLGSTDERPGWHEGLMISVFGTLAVMILACVIGRGVRVAAGAFALVYVLALVAWPIATEGIPPTSGEEPWIWYLLNLSTLAAVLAFPFPLQIGWTILAPVLFGVVRLMQLGFSSDYWVTVGLDVSFALILGGVIVTLGWLFRSMAVNVDETRARAVASYARAAAADASEQERVAVAALMHDSVLAALIAAERASTPRERTLAASMAREALTRLANTEQDAHEGTDEPWDVAALAAEIDAAAGELGVDVDVQREFGDAGSLIPGRVARALALAATQAVANALQHAGGAGLGVAVMEAGGRVRVEVHDAGEGFDLDAVPDDRLGIRASIMARVAAVGGHADLETGPHGTVVRLTWQETAA